MSDPQAKNLENPTVAAVNEAARELQANMKAQLPFVLTDEELQADKALGGEVRARDIAMPFLYVVQSNSPQCNPDHAKYIAGAQAGHLLLTVVNKTFPGREGGLDFIPVYYERELVEWRDRNAGGGIVNVYDKDDPIQDKIKYDAENKPRIPNGNLLVETAYHMLLVRRPDSGIWTYSCCPLKSTALKESRALNSLIGEQVIPGTDKMAPRFMYVYNITTHKEQKQTQIWSNPTFKVVGPVPSREIYETCRRYAMAGKEVLARARSSEEQPDAAPMDSQHI